MSAKIYIGSVCVFVPVVAIASPEGGSEVLMYRLRRCVEI